MRDEPKRLTLHEVIDGARRAAARVEKWPEWKKRWAESQHDKAVK